MNRKISLQLPLHCVPVANNGRGNEARTSLNINSKTVSRESQQLTLLFVDTEINVA
jgi:hypothetical protein